MYRIYMNMYNSRKRYKLINVSNNGKVMYVGTFEECISAWMKYRTHGMMLIQKIGMRKKWTISCN